MPFASARKKVFALIGIGAVIASASVVLPTAGAVLPANAAQDPAACQNTLALVNGGFEQPVYPDGTINFPTAIPGWQTTDVRGAFELWSQGAQGVPAATGRQFAELNAYSSSTLFQDVTTTPGQTLSYSLQHRGRNGTDTMAVLVGPPNNNSLTSIATYSDGNTAWGTHSGTYVVPEGQTTTRFAFRAVSSAGGNASAGNFLDSISFGTGPCIIADKTVQNVSGNNPTRVGDTLRYTVTATNNGGNPALLAVVNDALATGVTYVPGSMRITAGAGTGRLTDQGGDDRGEYTTASRNVAVRLGDGASATGGGTIQPGATTTATFDTVVNVSAANGSVANAATVGFTDPILGQTRASTTQTTSTTIAPAADLAVTKVLDTTPVVAGQPISYTVTASNNGPQAGTGVRVTDTLPAGLTGVTATGADCTVTGTTIGCAVPDLAVGASTPITITGTVPATADPGAGLTNTATIAGSLTDPDRTNNTATAAATVTTAADLSIVKTYAPTTPVAGEQVTYTLTARNDGPSDARGVTITDPLDPEVTFVSATVPGGTCTLTDDVVTCDAGTLAAGTTQTATITVTLAPDAAVVQNTAAITSSTPETDPTDNTSSTQFAATTSADLSIAKTATPATATAGDEVIYTLTATNNGPSEATNAVLKDTLPAGVTATNVVSPAGATCDVADGAVQCQWATLARNATSVVTITATIAADAPAGSLRNTASIVSPTSDPDTTNNSASANVDVEQDADLAVTKTANPNPAVAGGPITFTITTTNNGPSVARAVVTSDPLPATITGAAASDDCSIVDGVVICQIGDLAPGGSSVRTVTATVPASGAGVDVVNTASTTSSTPDGDAANDQATVTVPVTASADVSVVKTAASTTVRQGQPVQYTVTTSNAGVSDAQSVTIQERPAAGLTITSAVPSAGTYDPATQVWTVGTLANGASATLAVTATADAAGSLANQVVASSVTPDPDTADLTSTATVTATAVTPASSTADTATASFNEPATFLPLSNDTPSTGATLDQASLRLVDGAGNPVLTLATPQGQFDVDTTTGEITFTPVAGFVGTATAPYQVTDSDGRVSTSTVTATITGPPTAADDTITTPQGADVTVPVLGNDTGASGIALDPASVQLVDPTTGALVATLTVDGEGTYSVTPDGEVVFEPLPTFTGPATPVTYSVADVNGDRDTATLTVSVTAAPLPAGVEDTVGTAYNTPVTFSPTGNDDTGDPAASFDLSSVRLTDPVTGDPVTAVTIDGEGTYEVDTATGEISFTPVPDFTGEATPVSYTATTTFGESVTADATVTVGAPGAPTATDDTGAAPFGESITVSPLANDTSGPAGTSFVTSSLRLIDPATGTPATTVTVPGEGTWTVDTTTGVVTFAPVDGFTGPATALDYTATTNVGDTVAGSITVTSGTPPFATPDSITVPSGQVATINVVGNDGLGSAANFADVPVTFLDGDGNPVTMLVVPGEGTWTVGGDGRTVTFTPEAGFVGTATVPYQLTDSDGQTDVSTVSVTVSAAPVAVPDVATTGQNTPVTVTPLANDTVSGTGATLDPASLRLVDPATGDAVTTVTVPGEGTWTVGTGGQVTFTPLMTFSGTATPIGYQVTDTDGVTVGSTITATVVGVAPVASNDTVTVPRGGSVTIDPFTNDTAGTGDLDRSSLRLVDPTTGALATAVTIPGEGTYAVDTTTGLITFTPAPAFTGTSTIIYSVADGSGNRTTATLSVDVTAPPVAVNPGPGGGVVITTPSGQQLAFTGSQMVGWAGLAGLLLLMGGISLVLVRRKRRAQP
ncbi:beta strand repeat-containing protein [Frigoribacterium sp. CFBP 8751]|uniref:beta strand repeat-containing protein n=1 Tax=Frigoribacterium sp. CFBP 8751 TaxID=2775277 RepID=UPI0017802C9B|nr:Ig-like domain-containing protein [Frigoribacterium sp. CFBP 8751]MBD8539605.1 DUF11 domain-containing protein [Frigoribacterium sp. CFBP 8751]